MSVRHAFRLQGISNRICAALLLTCLIAFSNVDRAGAETQLSAAYQAAAACSAQSSARGAVFYLADQNVACFQGGIDVASADAFLALSIADAAIVVVDSNGGDAMAALNMADLMLGRHMSIVVQGNCILSCANYLFMAALDKFVLEGALLGFHGSVSEFGPVTYNGPEEYRAASLERGRVDILQFVQRQDQFWSELGVDSTLLSHPPEHTQVTQVELAHQFWEYGASTLHDRFHIDGIRHFATPDARPWLTKLLSRIYGFRCDSAGDDAWLCKE